MSIVYQAVDPDTLGFMPGWSASGLSQGNKIEADQEWCTRPMRSELRVFTGSATFAFNGTAIALRGVTGTKDILMQAELDGQRSTIYQEGATFDYCDDVLLFDKLGPGPHTLRLNVPGADEFVWVTAAVVVPYSEPGTGTPPPATDPATTTRTIPRPTNTGDTTSDPVWPSGSVSTTRTRTTSVSTTSTDASGSYIIPELSSDGSLLPEMTPGLSDQGPEDAGLASAGTRTSVIGAAVGGSLGALLVIFLLLLLGLRLRRRRRDALRDAEEKWPRVYDVADHSSAGATVDEASAGPIFVRDKDRQRRRSSRFISTADVESSRPASPTTPGVGPHRDAAIGELHDAMEAAGFTVQSLFDQLRVRSEPGGPPTPGGAADGETAPHWLDTDPTSPQSSYGIPSSHVPLLRRSSSVADVDVERPPEYQDSPRR